MMLITYHYSPVFTTTHCLSHRSHYIDLKKKLIILQPVLADDTKARVMRNRSLTKEEVEAFWRQHGKPAPVDVGDVTSPVGSPGRPLDKSPLGSSQRSRSPASSPVAGGHEEVGAAADAGKSRDWWTRSNSAFLNEAPQEERPGTAHSYTPQFHVAAGNA